MEKHKSNAIYGIDINFNINKYFKNESKTRIKRKKMIVFLRKLRTNKTIEFDLKKIKMCRANVGGGAQAIFELFLIKRGTAI